MQRTLRYFFGFLEAAASCSAFAAAFGGDALCLVLGGLLGVHRRGGYQVQLVQGVDAGTPSP